MSSAENTPAAAYPHDWLYAVPVGYLNAVAEAAIAYVDAMNAEGMADDTELCAAVEALREAGRAKP